MLALLNPKICPDRPITHCDTGGLSTVMKFCVSRLPNKQRFPVLRPGLRGSGVELIAHPVDGDVPQIHDRRGDQEHAKPHAIR